MRSYSFSGTAYNYASSEISTFKTFRQQYGFFEVRAKFPGVTGMWPAFWLMPDRATYGNLDGYYRSYIKFDLTGVGSVTSAQLKLTASAANTGVNNVLVMKVRNDSWTESGITWNNAPVPDPAWIKQYYNQAYSVGTQITTDVTAFVQERLAGHKVSFVLADTFMRVQQVKFYSREFGTQASRPQLIINGVTYYATEDAYVEAGTQANTTHGTGTELIVRDDWGDTATTYNGGMEFDIMESLGIHGPNSTFQTMHWDGYGADHQSISSGLLNFAATGDGYHTYGLYWQSGLAEFYVDGVKSFSWSNARVCSVPCFIILSLQLGGWDNNNPGAQVDNQTLQVDYVRAWSGTKSAALQFETENLTVAAQTAGVTERVGTDSRFSNGAGTFFDATAVNQFVTYDVPNVAAGTYDVRVGVKKWNNRGTWQLAISRLDQQGSPTNVGSPVDEYNSAELFTEVDLGNWTPGSTSDKAFRFMVTGKNASSTAYGLAFDYIKLIPQ